MARAPAKSKTDDEDIDPNAPSRNSHLIGHDSAEKTVLEAWNSGRFPHGWLITGPRGIGKATFAYRLARFILSNGGANGGANSGFDGQGGGVSRGLFGEELEADGLAIDAASQTSHLVASGGHPDLRVLTRGMVDANGKPTATIINVYQTRQVVNFTYQTSAISPWRVVIIDPADDFNTSSANAILKALEEPPGKAVFILLSHAPGGLLPTIRSRCRMLQLSPLSDQQVTELVQRYHPEVSAADAATLARLAEGSIGRALEYQAAGGLALFGDLMLLLSTPAKPDMAQVSKLADQVALKGREAAYTALQDLIDWWFKRVIRSMATQEQATPITPADAKAMAAFIRFGDVGKVMDIRDMAMSLLDQANPPANLDRRQIIVSLFTQVQSLSQSGH